MKRLHLFATICLTTVAMADHLCAGVRPESLHVTKLGSYSAGSFSDTSSAAEIVGHDKKSQRLFVVNGHDASIDVISIQDPEKPTRVARLNCSAFGQPNSVAVFDGVIAVAVQAPVKTDPGFVLFFDIHGGLLSRVRVGPLPDMVTFTPNGRFVLVANEGEPNDSYSVDPEGSVSIIDVHGRADRIDQSRVRTASFACYNEPGMLDPNVRIFGPGATVAQDLEPEYIAVSADSRRAYVSLQENNAIAVVDIASASVTEIRGLGFKDHAKVSAVAEVFQMDPLTLPPIGQTQAGQTIQLGGFSGLAFEGVDPATGRLRFLTHTDRGPNGEPTGIYRPFLLPGFTPEIVRLELDRATGVISIVERIPLQRSPGVPLSGLPNLSVGIQPNTPHNDEIPVDLFGNALPYDPLGADLEGVVIDPVDGSLWMCDEYRPALYRFTHDGVLLARYVPHGTAAAAGQAPGSFGIEALPAVLGQRRQNRGFEAVAIDNGRIYAWVQSPLRNPANTSNGTLNGLRNVRLVEFNPATLTSRQFIYVMDNSPANGSADTRADKIGDAAALGGGEFLVLERDDDSSTSSPADPDHAIEKKIYRVSLAGATELTAARETALLAGTGKSADQATLDELLAHGIQPVGKVLQVDLVAAGYDTVQKAEGLAVIDPWTVAVINDNDFQVAGIEVDTITGTFARMPDYVPEPVTLGLIDMQANGIDASDRDSRVNIRPWPVFGMYLPDAIATFRTRGSEYLITANEGDVREWGSYSEEARVGSLTLDRSAFPSGGTLKNNAQIGRLKVTKARGDIDGDGDFDALYAFGARSFSIWSTDGELVYDSGDAIEQLIAHDPTFSPIFNAGHTNNTRDDRSDDKGPEPEAIVVGVIGGRTFAFVGLERIGGVMIFDVSNPKAPTFVDFVNNRDPAATPGLDNGSDYGPEGLLFIPASQSPIRSPLLVIANEVSGTTTVYQLELHRGRPGRGD